MDELESFFCQADAHEREMGSSFDHRAQRSIPLLGISMTSAAPSRRVSYTRWGQLRAKKDMAILGRTSPGDVLKTYVFARLYWLHVTDALGRLAKST
eukprot:8526625-Pyramimonas_sp.AAC.1